MRPPLLFLATMLACAPRAARPEVPRSAVASTRSVAEPAPSRLFVPSSSGRPVEVWPREPGVHRVVVRGRPAEVRDGVVRGGAGRFLHAVMFAARVDSRRWRFVTLDGVWEADDYLAPPRLIVLNARATPGHGTGRPCLRSDDAVADLPSPPGAGAVLDAAFSDETHGIAVTEPGLAWVTSDNGAHWIRAAIEGAATSVFATRDGRRARTTHGLVALDDEGRATALDASDEARVADVTAEDNARFDRPDLRRNQDVLEPLSPASDDGSVLLARRGAELGLYRLRDESWVPVPPLPGECDYHDMRFLFAGRLHAICSISPDSWGATDLHLLDADGQWHLRLRSMPCYASGCVGSADGERVACEGACSADERECAAGSQWCESTGDGPPRPLRASRGVRWRAVGYVGRELLTVSDVDAPANIEMALGDGAPRRLIGEAPADLRRVIPLSAVVGRDGLVRMGALREFGLAGGLLEGPAGGRFAWRRVSDGLGGDAGAPADLAPPVLSADGVTATLVRGDGEVLVSRASDGPWEPLRAAPDDPFAAAYLAARTPIARPAPFFPWSDRPYALFDESTLVIGGGGPVRLASAGLGGPAPFSPPWRHLPDPDPAWRCESTSPAPSPALSATTGLRWSGELSEPRGSRVFVRDLDRPMPDGSARVEGYASSAELARGIAADPDGRWAVARIDARRATLVHVAASAPSREGLVEVWSLAANGPPTLVSSQRFAGQRRPADLFLVARGSRHATVMFSLSDEGPRSALQWWLAGVGPTGQLSLALVTTGRGGATGPYVLDGEVGYARLHADGSVVGGPPGAPSRVLAARARAVACSPSARGDLRLPTTVVLGERGGGRGVARYAFDGETACLRGVTSFERDLFTLAPDGDRWTTLAPEQSAGPYALTPSLRRIIRYRCLPQGASGAGGSMPRRRLVTMPPDL